MMDTVTVRQISAEEKQNIERVVQIHLDTFTGFFLTFMGRGFLRQMYGCYCCHTPSGLLGAFDEQGQLLGFAAYSGDMSGLYKYMLRKRLIPFAWYSLGAFLRKPKVFLRLIRAFLKPSESKREEAYVELSSIGVAPAAKGRGIGSRLLAHVKQITDDSRYAYVALETDARNNESANRFYRKNGFTLVRTYETREGRSMNEYRFEGM